jgi:NADPH:quinone reductase-like Zn-dependent oxidoreductase
MLRYGEAPDPTAAPCEIVVDIHAASVNAADYKVRRGGGAYGNIRFPHILGRDFSGVVSAVGDDITDLAIGGAVFGVTEQGVEGAYAEKIATATQRQPQWRSPVSRRSGLSRTRHDLKRAS